MTGHRRTRRGRHGCRGRPGGRAGCRVGFNPLAAIGSVVGGNVAVIHCLTSQRKLFHGLLCCLDHAGGLNGSVQPVLPLRTQIGPQRLEQSSLLVIWALAAHGGKQESVERLLPGDEAYNAPFELPGAASEN